MWSIFIIMKRCIKGKSTSSIFFILFATILLGLLAVPLVKKVYSDVYYNYLLVRYSQPSKYWPKPQVDAGVDWQELGELPEPVYPSEKNKTQWIAVGKKLFFDSRISVSGQIACVSCHHPDQRWTDNRRVSTGHNMLSGKRNSPSIANLSYSEHFFWDGRANSLEEQVLSPLVDKFEMNTSIETVVNKVNEISEYKTFFESITGEQSVNIEHITKAIAFFERSVVTRKNKFDRFLQGKKRLNKTEMLGLHLFRTKARCINCHHGPLFSDGQFHNLGIHFYGRKHEDLGRYLVTNLPEDVGKFKTPGLRDVMRTRPWMHNGLFDRIDGIINMYDRGMARPRPTKEQENDPLFPVTSQLLKPLNLTQKEKKALIAFLHAITF